MTANRKGADPENGIGKGRQKKTSTPKQHLEGSALSKALEKAVATGTVEGFLASLEETAAGLREGKS